MIFKYVQCSHLEIFAAFLCVFELTLQMSEPLADLVQDVVQLAVLGVVSVELGLVLLPLLGRDDGGVGPET